MLEHHRCCRPAAAAAAAARSLQYRFTAYEKRYSLAQALCRKSSCDNRTYKQQHKAVGIRSESIRFQKARAGRGLSSAPGVVIRIPAAVAN
jgi:hypothetical protein